MNLEQMRRIRAWGPMSVRRWLWLGLVAAVLLVPLAGWSLAFATADQAAKPLRAGRCDPLQVLDRDGRLLRELPAACGHRGRGPWVRLSQVPELLVDAVLLTEDRRFYEHDGVDLLAVARAAWGNLWAGRVQSGASTITMQLVRLLHQAEAPRTLPNKLREAWLAFALERTLSKAQILEAYLNYAYYGRGAYGVGQAAQRYFGRSLIALNRAELLRLALLPKRPSRGLGGSAGGSVLRPLLAELVAAGHLLPWQARAVEFEPLRLLAQAASRPSAAPHFVDWVLQGLPSEVRQRGGVLYTTLDGQLQRRLERRLAEHVQGLASHGLTDAALVVLDGDTSEVLAMIGSADYGRSQLNLSVRRRHPGSLLKPFVYALALESGRHPATPVYDVGDVPSAYRGRDWVKGEGGPLPMAEALAGSYNLAAVHTLEEVGVGTLRDRLRKLGVGAVPQAPAAYGLDLALGATRVRLLDVTAGFGFLVRAGRVQAPQGVRQLVHGDRVAYRPERVNGVQGFSPQVSWLVMNMLSYAPYRHRRFGRGLPVDGPGEAGFRWPVVAKTGTASGMSDYTAVVASREFLVGVWAGRLDGKPTQGLSGMWAAAPLAREALDVALAGAQPTLPERPPGLVAQEVCAESGMVATNVCPHVRRAWGLPQASPVESCTWHRRGRTGQVVLEAPAALKAWAQRAQVVHAMPMGR